MPSEATQQPPLRAPDDGSPASAQSSEDVRFLLEKSVQLSEKIFEQNRKIKRRLLLMVMGSYIRLALILVPIILGIVYLPPLLRDYTRQIQSVFGSGEDAGPSGGPAAVFDIFSQLTPEQIQAGLKLLQQQR